MRRGIELVNLEEANSISSVWCTLSTQFNPALNDIQEEFDGLIEKIHRFGTTVASFDEGRLAGAISFYSNDAVTREAYVSLLAVLPSWRRKGIGSLLLRRAELISARSGMSRIRLEVRVDNPTAQAFYRRMGYVELGCGSPGFVSMCRDLMTERDGLE